MCNLLGVTDVISNCDNSLADPTHTFVPLFTERERAAETTQRKNVDEQGRSLSAVVCSVHVQHRTRHTTNA